MRMISSVMPIRRNAAIVSAAAKRP
jgi:hypothetical protein